MVAVIEKIPLSIFNFTKTRDHVDSVEDTARNLD